MTNLPKKHRTASTVAGACLMLLVGCASQAPVSGSQAAPDQSRNTLACTLPSNCVSSEAGGRFEPLRFEGTPAQGQALLRTTLAEFPEAKITDADALSLEAVFTTAVGFKDRVSFEIDATAQRIHYRSRSSFGLFDFGKNASRMAAFSAKFDQLQKR